MGWIKEGNLIYYNKYITKRKIKYLYKNIKNNEDKIKNLKKEILLLKNKIEQCNKILGMLYCNYDEEDLKEDIKRFEKSYEVTSGKNKKTIEQLACMKKMLPFVAENGKYKELLSKKINEKNDLEAIIKGSNQSLFFLSNFYKNIKKKIEKINQI